VTRCAADLIEKMRLRCAEQFENHWQCLERHNQEYYPCRKPERALNTCMFDNFKLAKKIPGSPEGQAQIHEVEKPIFKALQK